MKLTAEDIGEIMRLLDASHFDELVLEMDGVKLALKRGVRGPVLDVAPERSNAAAPEPAERPRAAEVADPDTVAVAAPLLGVFYRAPKPGAAPFVELGSRVEEDTVVAIIEVMKLMNSVRAGVRGEIVDIAAENGAMVEYGQTLLRVRKG